MLVSILIMLREGLEAALIVGIVASFIKQSGNGLLMKYVWGGVVLAALMCLGVGYGFHVATGEIPQKQQELFVGIIGFVAVAMITSMVFWMKKAGRAMKDELQSSVEKALNRGRYQGMALVVMAFLAVAREGLESVFFLISVFEQSEGMAMPIGAVLGVLVAILVGVLIYQGGLRLNLAKFFRITGAFLIVVAAGLLAGSLGALHEAGVWNNLQAIVFDATETLSVHTPLGTFLAGLLGYNDHPTVGEVAIWFLYLVPTMWWYLKKDQPKKGATSASAV
jgi:high-affinity iron transporter